MVYEIKKQILAVLGEAQLITHRSKKVQPNPPLKKPIKTFSKEA
jgi:hypothetical protein